MSDQCEVSLGDYDGDEASFYRESQVKSARKTHQCFECRQDIPKGASYLTVSGRWDGEFITYRFCEACWEIMGEFSECGRTFGVMWDEFETAWNFGSSLQGCLNRVTSVAAKQRLTEQFRKFKKLP